MTETQKDKKENIHKGHRDRVKKKFLADGFTDATPDHEILELMLFYSVPQKDTNELAHRLLDHFGSYSNIFEAEPKELMAVKGISEHSAALIKMFIPVIRRYNERKTERRIKLESFESFAEYVKGLYVGETVEVVRLFLFNNKKELLAKEIIATGDFTKVNINSRKIIEVALKYGATYAILAHNHPQGFAVLSLQDRKATTAIRDALRCVDVRLCDHVIIGNNQSYSMRCDTEFTYYF